MQRTSKIRHIICHIIRGLLVNTCHRLVHTSFKGACVELERHTFKRALLRLPCFHHILELVLGGFIQHRWKTNGPRDALYARFQSEWPKIREHKPDILSGAKDKVKEERLKVESRLPVATHSKGFNPFLESFLSSFNQTVGPYPLS